MWITDDSELLLEVLEVHDDHLIVVGEGDPFPLRPTTEAVLLSFDEGDPVNMVRAAQAAGFDPVYAGGPGSDDTPVDEDVLREVIEAFPDCPADHFVSREHKDVPHDALMMPRGHHYYFALWAVLHGISHEKAYSPHQILQWWGEFRQQAGSDDSLADATTGEVANQLAHRHQ